MSEHGGNHSDLELTTAVGSFRARGYDGMMILLVTGAFAIAGGMFYLVQQTQQAAGAVQQQLIALEQAQRMTLCVLALPDNERWAQITRPDSLCTMLAKYPPHK